MTSISDGDGDNRSRNKHTSIGANPFPYPGGDPQISAEARYRAALVVAAHATDSADARELLDMLGLLDIPHPRATPHDTTVTASGPPSISSAAPQPRHLVDSATAARALHTVPATLDEFAELRIVTPARVDRDGTRWWSIQELHDQISSYRGDGDED